MHVTRESRAVEYTLAQRHVLMRARCLETEELATCIGDQELQTALDFDFLQAVFRHIRSSAHDASRHG